MLTKRSQFLIIFAIVMVAYYPVLSAGLSAIDDYTIISGYAGVKDWDLRPFIMPSGRLYFRPLTALTFLTDKRVFDLNPFWMHLENILLHLINAILVFFLARRVLQQKADQSYLPLSAALLFALHPINTESVCWISGRTDVLATAFLLSACLLLVIYKESHQRHYLILSLGALLAGAFSKETALAFLPGFLLIVTAHTDAPYQTDEENKRHTQNITRALILGSIIVIFISFVTRSGDFIARQSRMAITLRVIFNDWMHTMFVVLRAFGFYVKKLLIPLPLNFSILEVDPFYEIIAVPLVIASVYIATRRSLISALFTSGLVLIAPAFVLAFGQIAWTPYAERYIYASSAFIILAAVLFVHSSTFKYPRAVSIAGISLLLLMFMITLNRSMIWKDDILLAKDTVQKSPLSRDMRALYGSLLAKKGRYEEALHQLEEGKRIPGLGYDVRFDVTIGSIYELQGKKDLAMKAYKTALIQTNEGSVDAMANLVDLLEREKRAAFNNEGKRRINRDLFPYTQKLYELNHDPHVLFKLGIICSELGQTDKALHYFEQAYALMNDNDVYRRIAKKKIGDLSLHHAKTSS